MWRTSPSRYSLVQRGAGAPAASASARARSPTVRGVPDPTFAATTPDSCCSTAATVAAAMSRTWTKSRRWPPSSKTRTGRPCSIADRKIAATPA